MTMKNIKAVCSKSNERSFVIQCVMDEYEESNSTIQARHLQLFKDDFYKFEASKELVLCMPFDCIDGFVVSLLAPSQRYSTIKEEEVCQL
jgi:hypothetical protein